ncbi:MFS general substrate transporter, partial [Neoconidiobolus thromboides FSU 785]
MNTKKQLSVVFLTLLIDLFAFTVILPIFPSLIVEYQKEENFLLTNILYGIRWFKTNILNQTGVDNALESTLLGGIIGSLFSILQFIISPIIGKYSDTYGRKKTLIITVIGNLISSIIWFFAKDFSLFLLARVVAGLSEGNVQIATTIISDITSVQNRSKSMALVGLAFSIAFTVGPGLSGYFVSIDFFSQKIHNLYNPHKFSSAALLACVLIFIELILLALFLKESKESNVEKKEENSNGEKEVYKSENEAEYIQKKNVKIEDIVEISKLNNCHLLFLFLFSGIEFTLPFLAQHQYKFNSIQQGRMFGYLGILSACIQGFYVRRYKFNEGRNIVLGMLSCVISLLTLAFTIHFNLSISYLYLSITFLSFTSATVVSSMSSLTSIYATPIPNQRGEILGTFRSFGQLGRAIGPIVACTLYWAYGPIICYVLSAIGLTSTIFYFNTI